MAEKRRHEQEQTEKKVIQEIGRTSRVREEEGANSKEAEDRQENKDSKETGQG